MVVQGVEAALTALDACAASAPHFSSFPTLVHAIKSALSANHPKCYRNAAHEALQDLTTITGPSTIRIPPCLIPSTPARGESDDTGRHTLLLQQLEYHSIPILCGCFSEYLASSIASKPESIDSSFEDALDGIASSVDDLAALLAKLSGEGFLQAASASHETVPALIRVESAAIRASVGGWVGR